MSQSNFENGSQFTKTNMMKPVTNLEKEIMTDSTEKVLEYTVHVHIFQILFIFTVYRLTVFT